MLDLAGNILTASQRGYVAQTPRPGIVELDAEIVAGAALEVLDQIRRAARSQGAELAGLAIAASVDDVIFVDAHGQPIAPAIMAADVRAVPRAKALFGASLDATKLHAITGLPMAPIHPLARLLWLRDTRPADFSRVRQAIGWGELILGRLGVAAVTDPSQAARSMAWDLRRSAYSTQLLDAADLEVSLFPKVRPTGSVIGQLLDGMRVVVGAADQQVAALGAGITDERSGMVGMGSWQALSIVVNEPISNESLAHGGYSVGPHSVPDRYLVLATSVGGGTLLRWLDSVTGGQGGRRVSLRGLPRRPTRLLVQPHISGAYSPWLDPGSRAAIVGFGLDTTRGELVKAVLEGICFELRLNAERLSDAGVGFETLRATGGGARSPTWLQITADILGRPVARVAPVDTGSIGAASLAAFGLSLTESPATLARRAVRVQRVFEPQPTWQAAYDERYVRYLELYPSLRRLGQPAPSASKSTRRS